MASNWGKRFSYVAMKHFAKYMATYNMETQTIAVDGSNIYNIQSTGTGHVSYTYLTLPTINQL